VSAQFGHAPVGVQASAASGGGPSTAQSEEALAEPAVVLGTVRVYTFVLESPMDTIAAANERSTQ
jgi:hypothetical protein